MNNYASQYCSHQFNCKSYVNTDAADLESTVTTTCRYGNCVPYTNSSRANPCDPLFNHGIDYVFIPFTRTSGDIDQLNRRVSDTTLIVDLITDACKEPARRLLCYFYYPPCGNSTVFEPPKAVCSDTCFYLRDDLCSLEFAAAIHHFNRNDFLGRLGLNFIDCDDPGMFIHPLPHCCFNAGIQTCKLIIFKFLCCK